MNKNELLEIKKRLLALGLASIMIGSVAGCSAQDTRYNSKITDVAVEYDYNNFIRNSYILKYKNIYNDERYVAVYLELIKYRYRNGPGYNVFNLENNKLLYRGKDNNDTVEATFKSFCDEIGVFVSAYKLSKFLVAEYGIKSSYTKQEITDLIEKLNNGEIKFEKEVIISDTGYIYKDDNVEDNNPKVLKLTSY